MAALIGGVPKQSAASEAAPVPSPPVYRPLRKPINLILAYFLNLFLGVFGAHHFYLRRWSFGAFYLITAGCFGIGWIVDLFRLPFLVYESNCRLMDPNHVTKKSCVDAYITWFPLGLFGAHHFYLGRPGWGILYLFTVGGLGFGWIFDGFRLTSMVKAAKGEVYTLDVNGQQLKNHGDAYCLALMPCTGLFGAHHFYLGRPFFGVLYALTFGLLGIGWLVDLFRTPCLTNHVNKLIVEGGRDSSVRLDDCYLCLFPFGFLGLHHFFLRRPGWGCLYLLTFGCLGIGWLVDFCRLPFLVKDHNHSNLRFLIIAPASRGPAPDYSASSSDHPVEQSGYGSMRSWNEVSAANAAAAAEAALYRDLPPTYEDTVAAVDPDDGCPKPSHTRDAARSP